MDAGKQVLGSDRYGLMQAMFDAFTRSAITFWDNTLGISLGCECVPAYERRCFFPGSFATLGWALPAAPSAKLACADRDVVVMTGDGSFLFTMGRY